MNEPINKIPLTRRHVLAGAGAIGFGLVAAACGSSTVAKTATSSGANTSAGGPTTTGTASPNGGATDLKIAALAAGLEVLAVGTYKAALDAATAGKLGTVPPAVGDFVGKAMNQHQAQLDAWNKVITGAGGTAVSQPNATLKPTVDAAFAKVTDITGAAQLALQLEEIAAATYNNAQSVLTGKDAIKLAGSIQIVDAQHVAILLFVLGQYPVPDVFAKVDKAVAA